MRKPGLENAVKWKWWVAPSDDKAWGVPLPEPEAPKPDPSKPGMPTITTVHLPEERPTVYEVKKGDALINIAKKFNMKVAQLKTFNGMADDKIKVGQELQHSHVLKNSAIHRSRHHHRHQTRRRKPEKSQRPRKRRARTRAKRKRVETCPRDHSGSSRSELDNLFVQIFLDREQFSAGPIDGKATPPF